ncbi:MAG: phosphoglucosamine mutase, partial [Anaerolineae bacterium]|nr:phosphoglucosamine mutase [Anaerolineae bacterium]
LAGLAAEGVTADDAGVITTPGVAHLARALDYRVGIVISASHNPAAQNGIKLIGGDGFKLSDEDQAAIEAAIDSSLTASSPTATFGQIRPAEQHRTRYLAHLTGGFAPDALAGLSVVLDCANGAAYEIAPAAFARLGADVTALGTSPTGANINVRSGSEYVRRHRETLLDMMQAHDAPLGIAFDGDADRVVFLTGSGKLIDGDHVMGVLATHLKAQGQLSGDTVVATTMSNSGLKHYLNEHGITLEQTKVGDRYVMARMREGGFVLGGEQAGHIILLDEAHTAGDGIYVGLLVASLAARDPDLLEHAAADIPKFPQVIASAHLAGQVPLEQVEQLQPLIDDTLAAFDQQGRVNVRYSGTEPDLLRVMIEGGMKSTQAEVVDRALAICNLVAKAGGQAPPHIDVVDTATGAKIAL